MARRYNEIVRHVPTPTHARRLMSHIFDNETETHPVANPYIAGDRGPEHNTLQDRGTVFLLMEVAFVHVLHDTSMPGGPTMTSEQVSDGLTEVRHEGSFVRRNRGCDMPFMQRFVVGGLNQSGSPFGVRCSRVYRELYMRIASSMRMEDSSSDDDSTTAEEEERSDDEVLGPN
jgi:hypothetical protein